MVKLILIAFLQLLTSQALAGAPQCKKVFTEFTEESIQQGLAGPRRSKIFASINAAKTYLDKRAQQWLERESGPRKCLCCHTSLAYSMSRTFDRSSSRSLNSFYEIAKKNSADETSAHWYSQASSPNTEAVIYSSTMVFTALGGKKITAVEKTEIKQSLEKMLSSQKSDGGYEWLNFSLEPFESGAARPWGNALAYLSARLGQQKLKINLDQTQILKLAQFIKSEYSRANLNAKVMTLWADGKTDALLTSLEKASLIAEVKSQLNNDGSMSTLKLLGKEGVLPGDGYATALTLIALIETGYQGPEVHEAAQWLLKNQKGGANEGAWPTLSANRGDASPRNVAFATDASTGYAVLALKIYESNYLNETRRNRL